MGRDWLLRLGHGVVAAEAGPGEGLAAEAGPRQAVEGWLVWPWVDTRELGVWGLSLMNNK